MSQEDESSGSNSNNYANDTVGIKKSASNGGKGALNQMTKKVEQPFGEVDDELNYASSDYADVCAMWGDNYGSPNNGGALNDSDGTTHACSSEETPDFGNNSPSLLGSRGRAYSESAATAAAATFQVTDSWQTSSQPFSSGAQSSPSPSCSTSAFSAQDTATTSTGLNFGFGELAQPEVSLAAWDWQAPASSYGMSGSTSGSGRVEALSLGDPPDHSLASTHMSRGWDTPVALSPDLEPLMDDGAFLHVPNQSGGSGQSGSGSCGKVDDSNYGYLPHM